jgi:hypothetical protein
MEKQLASPEEVEFFRNNGMAAGGDKATETLKLGSQNPEETVVMGPRVVNRVIKLARNVSNCVA